MAVHEPVVVTANSGNKLVLCSCGWQGFAHAGESMDASIAAAREWREHLDTMRHGRDVTDDRD